jgi:arginine exporter protein ArgO
MLVGAAFTAAVFATYLLIGLGFLAFAGYLQEQPHFQDVVRWLAVALAAVVGALVTNDVGLKKVDEIKVVFLGDLR